MFLTCKWSEKCSMHTKMGKQHVYKIGCQFRKLLYLLLSYGNFKLHRNVAPIISQYSELDLFIEIQISISQLNKMIMPIKTFLYLCFICQFFLQFNSLLYLFTNHLFYQLCVMDVNNGPFVKRSGHQIYKYKAMLLQSNIKL